MPVEHHRVQRSAGRRGLSYRFAVRSDDAQVSERAEAMFAGLSDPEVVGVDHWYSVTAAPGHAGAFDVARDDELLAAAQCPGDALGWVVWDVNRSAAAASGQHLLFHAGALDAGGTGLLLPGASGSGKSTLTAGLARAGMGYLTDELAALDLTHGQLLPYAKPITLKRGSFAVVPELHPDRGRPRGARPWDGAEWQVAVAGATGLRVGGPSRPALVVVPRYAPGVPTRLTPLSDTEAFLSLALHAVNLIPHGIAGAAALGRLVAQSSCYALTMSDLDEACALVLGLVEATTAVTPGAGRGR